MKNQINAVSSSRYHSYHLQPPVAPTFILDLIEEVNNPHYMWAVKVRCLP